MLCFGDSLTGGYHGVWKHPVYGPSNPGRGELSVVKFHPYALKLGARLATTAAGTESEVFTGQSLAHAEAVHYSGWTASQLRPRLEAALKAGPWRACVILAGTNDVIFGVSAAEATARVAELYTLCERQGLPVIAISNPDCDTKWHGLVDPPRVQSCRAAIAELAAGVARECAQRGHALVDGRAVLPMDEAHAHLWDDSLHFSPQGSDILGDAVFEVMLRNGL